MCEKPFTFGQMLSHLAMKAFDHKPNATQNAMPNLSRCQNLS